MDPLTVLMKPLTKYLNDNELFYAFTGELALRMLGSGEETGTVELTANLTPEERHRLLNFLEQEGYVMEHRWRGPLEMRHRPTGLGLTLRLAGSSADMASIGRRVMATYGFLRFFIMSTEDLLLGLLEDKGFPNERLVALYQKWRNYLDMGYLITSSRARGVYPRFIKMKLRAEK